MPFAVALTLVALAVVLVGEARGSRWLVWLSKPVASGGFIAAALLGGALDSPYGAAVLIALGLSLLGDVLLIPAAKSAFRAGLFAFLLAHVAFAAAFVVRGIAIAPAAIAAAVLAAAGGFVYRWLSPHLSGVMRAAVPAYIVAIVGMTALAIATAVEDPGWIIAAGAVAFFLSDLAVARDRFVRKSFVNRLWGLPLYYLAQILLASSVP